MIGGYGFKRAKRQAKGFRVLDLKTDEVRECATCREAAQVMGVWDMTVYNAANKRCVCNARYLVFREGEEIVKPANLVLTGEGWAKDGRLVKGGAK